MSVQSTPSTTEETEVSHGTFKPRNKYVNDLLMSKGGGAHEAKAGKRVKRAKAKQQLAREMKDQD